MEVKINSEKRILRQKDFMMKEDLQIGIGNGFVADKSKVSAKLLHSITYGKKCTEDFFEFVQ
jgi:hypothetical protein